MFATIAFAHILVSYFYPNIGTIIKNPSLALWIDTVQYLNETLIDWGNLNLTEATTYQFDNMTVVNTGNVALTVYVVTENLPSTWTLTWTANTTLLTKDAKTEAPLILTIPADATEWPTWGFYLNGE